MRPNVSDIEVRVGDRGAGEYGLTELVGTSPAEPAVRDALVVITAALGAWTREDSSPVTNEAA